jgi:branched-chain amino acid transport system substrate-binding protein
MKRRMLLFGTLLVIAGLLLSSCAPAATPAPTAAPATEAAPTATPAPAQAEPTATPAQPAAQVTDEWGVVVIPAGKTIKIGLAGPLTGDYANFGIDISRGAELALEEHPEVKGFKVEFVTQDTQGSPEQGAAVANKFASDPQMVGIVGHIFSGETEASIPIYEKAGIVMVSPSATNPTLTELGSKVFNRVAFTDKMQGEFAAKYIYEKLGVRKVVTMHDGGAYGQGLAGVMAEAFKALGGEVLGTQAITPGETDYSAPLAAVAALGPELIYFGGYDTDAAVLVSQMESAGLKGVIFFGCDGTYGENYLKLAGKAAEGTYSTYVPIPESEAFEKFRARYKERYGDEQGKLSPFSPHGHDAMAIILAALEKVAVVQADGSLAIPRKALADAVRATKDFPGLTGTITCSEVGECAAASIQFMVVKDGKWVVAE